MAPYPIFFRALKTIIMPNFMLLTESEQFKHISALLHDIHSVIYPWYGYPWCPRPSTQALLYLVPSKYLFLLFSRAHSSDITYLSNERFCRKFGRFFAEILKSEYQEILPWSPIHTEIYGVLKVKNRNFSTSFLCNENCIEIF